MRKIYLLSFLFLAATMLPAQIIPITNGTVSTCDGIFTDTGKNTGTYQANENYDFTICPGSQGGSVRLTFAQADFRPGDVLDFYDGTSSNSPLLTSVTNNAVDQFIVQATNPTGCLTMIFTSNSDEQDNGWVAGISCTPNCQEIQAQLTSASSPIVNNTIKACIGDEISFSASALFPNNNQNYNQSIDNCTFTWIFDESQTTTGQSVSHIFSEPGGTPIQLKVTDQFGCTSSNSIEIITQVAQKPILSSQTMGIPTICANEEFDLFASATDDNATLHINQPESFTSLSKTHSDSLALPDGTGASYVSVISYNEFDQGAIFTNVSDLKKVFVNMEHSWMRDLEIFLECPNGTRDTLVNHPSNTGGEIFLGEPNELDDQLTTPIPGIGYDYNWTPTATNVNWIQYANENLESPMPAGDYQPFEPFEKLLGCPLNGDWKLEVVDRWSTDNGYIFSWGIEFDGSLYAQGESFTPEIQDISWLNNKNVITDNGDNITIASSLAGMKNFTVQVTNDFGCVADTQVTVNVLPFSSPDCYECGSFKTALRDTAICPGQSIDFDATFDNSMLKSLGYEHFSDSPITANSYENKLTVTDMTPTQVDNVNYRIDSIDFLITASQPTEIEVYIQSPSGTQMLLGSSITVSNTSHICFKPNSTLSIVGASAPFSASYKPQSPWNTLQGQPINGDWKLLVNNANNETTTLISWGITFKNNVSTGYHWTGTGLSCTDCPTPSINPYESSIYVVEVYDNYNCSYKDTAVVNVIQALSPPVINEPTYEDGQITFTWQPVTNAISYLIKVNNSNWITPNGDLSQTFDNYVMGDEIDFKVKAVSAAGCDGSDANILLKITNCLLNGSQTTTVQPSCVGIDNGEILLSATNGTPPIVFSLDGGINQANGDYTGLSTGNHFAIISDDAGCHDTLVFAIQPAKELLLSINTTDVTCHGDNNGTATAILSGGPTNPISYTWQTSPVQNTQSINSLSPGNYNLTVSDADGCTLNGTAIITEPTELTASFEDVSMVTCYGLSDGSAFAKGNGGTSPYAYQWNTGETSDLILDKPAGSYTVTITDGNNCTAESTVLITQPNTALSVVATQSTIGCAFTQNNKAQATGSGGKAPYNYTWNDGQDNAIANNLAPGNYSVTATDDNGCTASTTLSVADYDLVVPTLDFTPPTCNEGSDATVFVTSIAGGNSTDLADYTYQWLGQAGNTTKIENLKGDKSYYVTVTGSTGCKGSASIFVTEPDPISINLDATPVTCAGDSDGSVKIIEITGNPGPYTIQWGANANSANTEEVLNLSGNLYQVTVTNPNGCVGTNQIQVKEAPPLERASLLKIDPKCYGDQNGSATIELMGGAQPYQYNWTNGSVEESISLMPGGTYYVTSTDSYGCVYLDSITLEEPTPVTSLTSVKEPICYGENNGELSISTSGGIPPYQYSLNNSSYFDEHTIADMAAGEYTAFAKDSNGCISIDTVVIGEPALFSVDAGPDLQLSYGEVIELSIEANNAVGEFNLMLVDPLANVTECTGCFDIDLYPKYHGVYQVVATDEMGCIAIDEVDIKITRDMQFLVPTAFTPNGDGANDVLTCHTKNKAAVNNFRVYDRWGELVFEKNSTFSNELTEGWDGLSRGKKMPAGTYIWTADVTFDTGERIEFKGQTNLIR